MVASIVAGSRNGKLFKVFPQLYPKSPISCPFRFPHICGVENSPAFYLGKSLIISCNRHTGI